MFELVSIKDDKRLLDEIERDWQRRDRELEIVWGLPEGSDPGAIYKGVVNDLGQGRIPARPWLSQTARIVADALVADAGMEKVAEAILGRETPDKVTLEQLASLAEETVRQLLLNYGWQPNAPFTVEKKGFNHPLVETHRLGRNPAAWPAMLQTIRGLGDPGPSLADSLSAVWRKAR